VRCGRFKKLIAPPLGTRIDEIIIVARAVSRFTGSSQFGLQLGYNGILNHLSALAVDWMSDISVQLLRRVMARVPPHPQLDAALVTKLCAKVVFVTAPLTMARQLATGHGHEWSINAIDNFQIAHHKTMVERDGAEGA
jgi:hypothetical protein